MEKTKKGGKSPLGERITELARQKGFAKPSDFADAHSINIRTFNDLIYGYTKIMPDSLIKVSEALGVEPWILLAPIELDYKTIRSLERRKHGAEKNSSDSASDGLGISDQFGASRANDVSRKHSASEDNVVTPGFLHTLSSDIAAQVITALKSETKQEMAMLQREIDDLKAKLPPSDISEDRKKLLALGLVIPEARVRTLVSIIEATQNDEAGLAIRSPKRS